MAGNEVFKFAVALWVTHRLKCSGAPGFLQKTLRFHPHQANIRIIDAAAQRLGLSSEHVFVNVHKYGNTSAASIGIALSEAVDQRSGKSRGSPRIGGIRSRSDMGSRGPGMDRDKGAGFGVTQQRVAFIFPGQGAQYVGMGRELAEAYPVVAETLREAEAALGEPLTDVMFHGPAERLKQTYYTQPAILSLSVAIARLATSVVHPCAVAGHSLGEYSALVAAGCLSLKDAVCAVRLRARFMEEAVPPGTGIMAAVLGLEAQQVEEICQAAGGLGDCGTSHVQRRQASSCSGHAGRSGNGDAPRPQAGARRVQPLNVSGPFHSSLLEPAGKRLRDVLQKIRMRQCEIPVYCNAYAAAAES